MYGSIHPKLGVAAAKQRTAQAAEENRTGRLETNHSSSEPQSAGAMMVKKHDRTGAS